MLPSPSKPSGGTTGTMPLESSVCSSPTSTRSTLPVKRWSTPCRMPSGWAITAFVDAARRSAAERPSRISWVRRLAAVRASFRVAASVTPEPSRSEGSSPRCSARALIWSDAPWTSTVRMLSDRSTATSIRMLTKFSSVTTAPSTATTNVFSRNWGTYCRMPRRSVGFTPAMLSSSVTPRKKHDQPLRTRADPRRRAPPHLRHLRHREGRPGPPPRARVGGRGPRPGPAAPEGARPREGPLRDRGPRHHPPGPDRRGGLRGRRGLGAPRRLPDRGGRRQHRPGGREPVPDPLHPHPRRPHRRDRRVRLLHDGRGRAQALPGRGAGARARVDDLAPLPAVAGGRGDGTHAGRARDGSDRPEHGGEGGRLRHGRALPQHVPLRRPRRLRHRRAAGDGPPAPRRALAAASRRSRSSRSRTRCGGPTSSRSTSP